MRLTILVITLVAGFTSCKKNTLQTEMPNAVTADTTAMLKYTGNFVSGPYGTVAGKAEIYKTGNKLELNLSGFSSSNGPALHVFISKEPTPANFIDLGVLQANAGNQVYKINGTPSFTEYKYVCIHCVDYDHLFGWALLQ